MRFLTTLFVAWALCALPAQSQPAADTSRIVTLGGSVTEIVYALGAGDQVVGVDASSVYPEAATEKPSVGYFRQLPAEGVLSLDPSLVLALEGTGPPTVLDQLRSAGVRVEVISDGEVVWERDADAMDLDLAGEELPGPTGGSSYYYLRARQADGHLVWLSPVWVDAE